MKKTAFLPILLFLSLSAFAQFNQITGFVKSEKPKTDISLFSIEDGAPKLLATTFLGSDGSFGFLFKAPAEGFYVLGYADLLSGQFPLYLKPGDNAEVVITDKMIEYTGNQTPENTILASWSKLTEPIKIKSVYFNNMPPSNYKDFFPAFEEIVLKAEAFRKTINSPNRKFNILMDEVVTFDMDFYAINLLRTPRTEHPKGPDQYPAYYKTIVKKDKFQNDDVLLTLYGKRYLGMYAEFAAGLKAPLDEVLSYLTTDRQKGAYIISSRLTGLKSYDKYKEIADAYSKYFITPAQKKSFEDLGASLYSTAPGGEAASFTYPDKDGKLVSLGDFKGKVVLVDVWATWCGPCKKEIPSLNQLENEMHGKDIVFVSVSVDEDKDKAKWEKMIKDQNLGGIQLFASGWSKITKDYKITGIPRFMVFDRQGKIATIDAPRPSSPDLKKLLISLL